VRARAIALLLCGAACAPALRREELPADPIAFVRTDAKAGIATTADFLSAIRYGDEEHRDEQEQRRTRTSIMLLTLPTNETRPVPDSAENALPLDWSRDGTRLLIARPQRQRGSNELVLWNRLTGAFDRTSPGESAGFASLADGPILSAAVAFLGDAAGRAGPSAIVVYTASEGLTVLPDSAGGVDPDVAPDGRTVVFSRRARKSGPSTLVLGGLEAGSARSLGRGESPRYSRDGRWIAYVSRVSGNADVWIMRSDGSNRRAVTRSVWDEVSPAPSPDGRYVVYSSVRASLRGSPSAEAESGARKTGEESHLYLARVEDGYEIQLTQNSQNGRPVW
jgi:hypothetical protein